MKRAAETKRDEIIQKAKKDYESEIKRLDAEFHEKKVVIENASKKVAEEAPEEEDQIECKLCYDEENMLGRPLK